MVHDLPGELEVIKAFFARGTAWVATETAGESARLALMTESDEEFVEHVATDPNGASALEQIVLRAVIGELNSLYEFALQQAWICSFGLNVPTRKGSACDEDQVVFVANRWLIEDALKNADLLGDATSDVEVWPGRQEVLEVKELAEGFKHRHRLQPLPEDCYQPGQKRNSVRRVNPEISATEHPVAGYQLTQPQVARYIGAFEELLRWLSSKKMLGLM